MLGNCWEYDIRSSVIAWKMGFARSYLQDHGLALDIKAHFPWSLLYLEHKADFLGTIRHYVFTEDSIEWQMREQTGNPYWHLTPEQLQRYQPKSLNERKRLATPP